MAVPQFIYDALPLDESRREIRLLRFDEHLKSTVTVTMIKASLEDPDLSFNALSYCWGEPIFDQVITCNGEDVRVTAGLFSALRRMQHMPKLKVFFEEEPDKTAEVTLWVDQLCINQSDNAERSNQVQIMGDIYSGCRLCFCYLGEEEDHPYTSVALAYIKSRVTDASYPCVTTLALDEDGDLDRQRSGSGVQQLPAWAADDDEGAQGLLMLCECPYFQRGWIVQEVALSSLPLGICGQHIFPLRAFEKSISQKWRDDSAYQGHAMNYLMDLADNLPGGGRGMLGVLHMAVINLDRQEGSALFDIASNIRAFLVSDPRDKIYAALSLAKDRDAYPAAQYELSVEEIYRTFAEAFVIAGRGLDVIQSAGDTNGASQFSLPSWVPDWSVRDDVRTFGLTGWYKEESGSLDQGSITLGVVPGTLTAEARYICLLEEAYDHVRPSANDFDEFSWNSLLAMQQFMLKVGPREITRLNVWSQLRSLLQEASWEIISDQPFSESHKETFLRMVIDASATPTETLFRNPYRRPYGAFDYATREGPLLAVQIVHMIQHAMTHYTLALTTTGEIAVVPYESVAGDQIVHFKNALVPYTLRPNAGSNTYRPIGGAYIKSWREDGADELAWGTVTLA